MLKPAGPPPAAPPPAERADGESAAAWGAVASVWAFALMALARLEVRHWQPPFDFAPLFLGGHALRRGLDPGDKDVQFAMWAELGSGRAPGQFFNPYPATASLVMQPVSLAWTWAELGAPFRGLMVAALLAAALVIAALPGPSLTARLTAAGLAAFAAAKLGALQHALVIGQVSPAVVFLTVLGAVALVRGRDGVVALALALGGGLKLFPLLLLPATLPRPRALVGTLLVLGALAIGTWWSFPGWDPLRDAARAWEQATIGQYAAGRTWGGYWHLRGVVAAVVSGPLLLALLRRGGPPARAASAGLCLSAGGVVAGGLVPPHEAVLLLPATAFHIGWLAMEGWRPLPIVTALVLAILPATPLVDYPPFEIERADHASALMAVVLFAAVARAVQALRAPLTPAT